jgi:hypothetical protein
MTTARDIPVMPQRSAAWYLAATTALFCLIFILDILIPQGYSVPTLYLLPLVFSYRIPNRYAPAYAAALTTALTLAGLMVSPMGDLSAAYCIVGHGHIDAVHPGASGAAGAHQFGGSKIRRTGLYECRA